MKPPRPGPHSGQRASWPPDVTAYLILKRDRSEWSLCVRSEFPLSQINDLNTDQILVAKADGATYEEAANHLMEQLTYFARRQAEQRIEDLVDGGVPTSNFRPLISLHARRGVL